MIQSIAIRTPDTRYSLLDVTGLEFEDAAYVVSQQRYKAVGLLVTKPEELNANYVKSVLETNGLLCDQIITGPIWSERAGITLSTCSDKLLTALIDIGNLLETDICLGKFLGTLNSKVLREFVQKSTKSVSLEPIPYSDIPNTNTAMQVIKEIGCENLNITLDTCHAHNTGNLVSEIFGAGSKLKHVHISDSNREYPGSGIINFKTVREALCAVKYTGALTLEIAPKPYTDVAFSNGTLAMRKLCATI